MKITAMMNNRYLAKEDCDPPIVLTIKGFNEEDVSRQDEPTQMRYVMYFEEDRRGMPLNKSNLELGAEALGSSDTDTWIGKKIELYPDPSVMYGGKRVGGIRVRKPTARQDDPVLL